MRGCEWSVLCWQTDQHAGGRRGDEVGLLAAAVMMRCRKAQRFLRRLPWNDGVGGAAHGAVDAQSGHPDERAQWMVAPDAGDDPDIFNGTLEHELPHGSKIQAARRGSSATLSGRLH